MQLNLGAFVSQDYTAAVGHKFPVVAPINRSGTAFDFFFLIFRDSNHVVFFFHGIVLLLKSKLSRAAMNRLIWGKHKWDERTCC